MKPNTCHSKPRPTPETTITAQKGWSCLTDAPNSLGENGYIAIKLEIPNTMSCECKYSQTTEDPRCGAFPDLNLPICPHKA